MKQTTHKSVIFCFLFQPLSATEKCENNAKLVQQTCQSIGTNKKEAFLLTVRQTSDKRITLCPIYKVGTTFWRRVFMIRLDKKYSHFINPYQIPFDKEYPSVKLKSNITAPSYKVMFTRDPYNRLFSFFVDKMLAPNPVFWKNVGINVAKLTRNVSKLPIRCGHDVTFKEFIKYAIHTLETRQNIDPHWIEMEKNCRPCEVKYDYIGKMENFKYESIPIVDKMGLTKMAEFLRENGSDESTNDAIKDTLQQPFSFRTRYRSCVTFKQAVLRAWNKLRIRGLIGNDTLPEYLLDEKKSKMSDLVMFAKQSGLHSKAEERKAYKTQIYKDFWHSVDISDLHKLKKIYETDFKLFRYDDEPAVIFQRKAT